jgi:uncharacterized membrane protein YvbJ
VGKNCSEGVLVKLCKYCGNELADTAKFCGECGKPKIDDEKEIVAVPGDEASMKTAPQYEDNEKNIFKKEVVKLIKLLFAVLSIKRRFESTNAGSKRIAGKICSGGVL